MPTAYEDMLHYRFRPRSVGGEMALSLDDDALEIRGASKLIRIQYNEITEVKITFRPTSFLNKRYMVFVKDNRGARLKFTNVTFRGFGEIIEQNESFIPLVQGLHAKLKPFTKNITFFKGEPTWRYYSVSALSLAMILMGLNVTFKLGSQNIWLGLSIAAITAYMAIIMWQWVSNNKPRSYDGVLHKDLLPL